MDIQQLLAAILGGSQQAPQSVGFPTQVGDHANPAAMMQRPQMPQMQPQQAPMPQQVPQGQPMPQNAPQAASDAGYGGMGGLGGILQNIIAPQSAQRNKTVGWLQQQGLDPGTATILASDKGALRSYMLQRTKGQGPTEFDSRAQAADQFGLTDPAERRNFILSGNLPEARGGAAELGLQPQTGVDKDGNPVLLQLGKDGKAVQTAMPDGVTLSKTPIKIDAGTEWIILDPVTRQPVGRIPKDLAGAASQTKLGEAQAAASFDLPRIEQNAQQTLDVIEQLKTHPGRATATGKSGTFDPRNYIAGTDATNFKVLLDQVKGQTFLQAFQSLKGGGQITEVEGAKATDAIARLNTAQSDEEFSKALDDFESVIRTGLARAQRQAGQPAPTGGATPPPSSTPQAAPNVGDTRYGYRFKGGDPSEPSSWEKAN